MTWFQQKRALWKIFSRQKSNQLRCLREHVDIIVGNLFGDGCSGLLAIRTVDGTNTLSRRGNLFFASHVGEKESDKDNS
jgi:hypothetical protein